MRRILLLLPVLAAALALQSIPPAAPGAADGNDEQPIPISSSWSKGVQAYLKLETNSTVFNVLYHYGKVHAAAGGVYGPNVSAPRTAWFLEYQRAGGTDVIAGVLHRDAALVS